MNNFEQFGFYKEYYFNGKFIGTKPTEKDRETMGYFGRKNETLSETITLPNGKKIKANSVVETQLFPLCGVAINRNTSETNAI